MTFSCVGNVVGQLPVEPVVVPVPSVPVATINPVIPTNVVIPTTVVPSTPVITTNAVEPSTTTIPSKPIIPLAPIPTEVIEIDLVDPNQIGTDGSDSVKPMSTQVSESLKVCESRNPLDWTRFHYSIFPHICDPRCVFPL
jgi:hypothetical protein